MNVVHLQKFIVTLSPTVCYLESWFSVPTFDLFITISGARRRLGLLANSFKRVCAPVIVMLSPGYQPKDPRVSQSLNYVMSYMLAYRD